MTKSNAGASNTAGTPLTQSLYQKHQKLYPRAVFGLFSKLRGITLFILLGLYFVFPWITWGERQAVLFDLPGRKFYYFGVTFWPQDFFYLAVTLIILGLSLFLFTALAGRLWCGYSCPQTAWTQVFIWIEHFFEGDRQKRIKLDKRSLDRDKAIRKAAKHTFWLLLAGFTGFTFVGYFTPISELMGRTLVFDLSFWEGFWIIFFTLATYLNAGWMREQVCLYMCPYARFQSAMFDKDTLIISYDEERGEPRGSRRKSANPDELGLGSCVDCSLCVQVCPTGIDIRDGLQYECIGCAACVDVCNQVMAKLNYPSNLVRYTTERALHHTETTILRTRVIVYLVLWCLLITGLGVALYNRIPLELDIIRDRKDLYKISTDNVVSNVYTLKIMNMDQQDHNYDVTVSGVDGLYLKEAPLTVTVAAGTIESVPVHLSIAKDELFASQKTVEFHVISTNEPRYTVSEESSFIGPIDK